MPRCGDRERVGALGAGFSAHARLLGCSASAQYGALSVRGVCGGRRLGGGSEAGRLVQTELKPVLQPYGADRFFSLCFEDVVLPSRAVVLFCSSCTQAAARCDGEGLGASEGAHGLGMCWAVRCSGQTNAVGFGAGRRDQKRGTVRRGVSWDAAIRLGGSGAAGTAAVEGWSGRLLLGWVRTRHRQSESGWEKLGWEMPSVGSVVGSPAVLARVVHLRSRLV